MTSPATTLQRASLPSNTSAETGTSSRRNTTTLSPRSSSAPTSHEPNIP